MLSLRNLEPNQLAAVNFARSRSRSLLVLPVGFGKSVISLSAFMQSPARRCLVIAPLNVCKHTWATESEKWQHLRHLTVAVYGGSPSDREAAIASGADIVCVNPESLATFFDLYPDLDDFDGLIIDELTRFKATGGKAYRALRREIQRSDKGRERFSWRVGMTATPVEEHLMDIYAEMLLIDSRVFGTRKDEFLREYFNCSGYRFPVYTAKDDAHERIVDRLSDVTHFAARGSYDGLPELHEYCIEFPMARPVALASKRLKQWGVCTVNGVDIIADTAGVLSMKLQQLANGFIYDEEGTAHWLDDGKLRGTIADFHDNSDGSPVIVVYSFRAQLERLRRYIPNVTTLTGGKADAETIDEWNQGRVEFLALHPKSAGHGLNLQRGGYTMLMLSPIWSADLWHQVVGRIWRRGCEFATVDVIVAVTEGSVETLMLERVASKQAQASAFEKFLSGRG